MTDEIASIEIIARAPLAVFPRPECRRDSVTYPMITPTAARGILDNIHYRPWFRWVIDELSILNPIAFEVINSPGCPLVFALSDVAYGIRAHLIAVEYGDNGQNRGDDLRWARKKARTSINVYLGGKEYPGTAISAEDGLPEPLPITQDLGILLHGADFEDRKRLRFFHAVLDKGRLVVPPLKGPMIFG